MPIPQTSPTPTPDLRPSTNMSFVTRRHLGPTFDRERYEQIDKEATRQFKLDQAAQEGEAGPRGKFLSFFKKLEISDVVNKMTLKSKKLFSHPTSSPINEPGRSHSVEAVTKSYIPATETVTFPPETARPPNPVHATTLIPAPAQSFPNKTSAIEKAFSQVNTDVLSLHESVQYKERNNSREISFPEIQKGIVSIRVKWLEPHFGRKKVGTNNLGESAKGLVSGTFGKNINSKSRVLAISRQRDSKILVEKLFLRSESDTVYAFDDSPRLHKHRLPEEESKLRVEPGTVARGVLWLGPILAGKERQVIAPRDEKLPSSPTRVAEGRFLE